ncbi:hypothetical protein MR781_03790 [bacterium]|uniref:hypothetical protein n=1 Tax=Lachnospiraceae TaxID=186803 RepID=UPI002A7B773D|nr:hypothetical protein [bacterium]MCI7150565.1 hypothetical protein [bacterium]MDY2886551.1 hypothetical protein [Bariatricus sp.]MDY4193669.1 hypothetical protein [Bariatricus sp.]
MKLKQKASPELEKLKTLHGPQKIRYIWDYYKLPIVVLCILLYILGYSLYGHFTHKEKILYTALVNVSASDSLTEQLSTGFLDSLDQDTSKTTMQLYTGLYLTDDETNPYHEYTYASRMKILASIDGKQLDVVLMNKEAFDAFSQNGYLCDLEELLSSEDVDLYNRLKPHLVTNTVILEDNSTDLQLDPSITYQAVTEEHPFGLDLSQTSMISDAGFSDIVYLGIIANSPRTEEAIDYVRYLL